MKFLRPALLGLLSLAYPPLVYLGLGHFEPRWMALPLAGMAVVRAVATRERVWLAAAVGALALAASSMLGNHALPLKLYPVLVNTVLLAVFATSLAYPPSVIERLARLREPELPASGVTYTRRVTQVWCGFFVLNGGIALFTAIGASDETWALYNGLISYVLMGVLFAVEWVVRQQVRARHVHG
ncbi:hypothetical protein [Archangium lansingense]|uniref:DNA gyrase subunit B n=1 Tax=Archangium lansingense TaxID=2995310 RepID=A0ABT4A6V3_9BACT|nr:hypothetical protein [Archangium lansinium]MCY1077398.1 hypothetical protein [Archangium lansinium]